MTIGTKLRFISITTTVIATLFIGGTLFFVFTSDQSHKKQELSQHISDTSFKMSLLRGEYFVHPNERSKTQWIDEYEVLSGILDDGKLLFQNAEERKTLENIHLAAVDSRMLFGQLIQSVEQGGNQVVKEELGNQLAVNAQNRASDVLLLSRLIYAEENDTLRIFWFALAILGVLFGLIYVLFYSTTASVVVSVKKLGENFTKISVLDFSSSSSSSSSSIINDKNVSKDEIGVVKQAFNVMVSKLKESYAALEQKVKERTLDLKHAKAKDEAILASIGDGIAVANELGKIVFFNKTAVDIFGEIGKKSLANKWQKGYGMFDAVSLKPLPVKKMPLLRATQGQTVTKMPLFIRNNKVPDGKFVSVTATPILLNKKSVGGVAIFRDMTEEREIDKAKTEFVSLVSHQLRTPLTTISWYTEMILNGDAGKVVPKQKEYLEKIYQGNQRMIELVNTLLNVSHIELGTFVVEPKLTDIIILAQSVVAEQKHTIEEKKLEVITNFSSDIPLVFNDPKLIRMVFQNLLANAVEYIAPKGKIDFVISRRDEKTIRITMSDTGYGIPKKQQDKIFTKLFRADNVRDKDTDGTGLGLYIVKSVVENSGGRIWFESEENKGTTFFVTLPIDGMKKK